MYGLNGTKDKLSVERYNPLFLQARRITFLVAGVLLALLVSAIILLSCEVSALQQEAMKLRQSIAHSKSIYSIYSLEREWARYAVDIYRAAHTVDAWSVWGDRLGILSRTIPQGAFLDYISVAILSSDESKKIMTLETIVVTKEKPGLELASSFLDQLKNEKEYGKEIKINFAEKVKIDGKDLEEIQIMVKVP